MRKRKNKDKIKVIRFRFQKFRTHDFYIYSKFN